MKLYLIAAASLLTACSVTPSQAGQAPRTSAVALPRPSVEVLGTKLTSAPTPRPAPKISAMAKPSHKTVEPTATHTVAATRKAKPKPATATCIAGKPCSLTGLKWTKTYGCTLAGRKATGLPCPPGWPPIP